MRVVASVVDVDVFLLVSVSAAALAQSLPASTSGAVCPLEPARLRRMYQPWAFIRGLLAVRVRRSSCRRVHLRFFSGWSRTGSGLAQVCFKDWFKLCIDLARGGSVVVKLYARLC